MMADREGQEGHPCPKPLGVWEWLLERVTIDEGQTFLDPFLGSGASVIAAQKLKRQCIGLELTPQYIDLIIRRWQDYTGQAATLEGNGGTFDQIQAERLGVAEAAG